MATDIEKLDNSMVKLKIEIKPDKFEEGMKYSYGKNKSRINVQGFRKGKVPRKIIEAQYGPSIFYDDAINYVIPKAYESALDELDLKVTSRPIIKIEDIEKNQSVFFTAEVAVRPEIVLGQYRDIEVEKMDTNVTDEDIQQEIKKVQDKNSRLITVDDRTSQNGDIVTIDFEGFIDGIAFEGGKDNDFDLELGSHTFIGDFEEQLIGKNLADDVEVNVTFPDDYAKEDLAGKPALFKVEIKDIKYKELPEVDDEFAKDVSEFDTLDEYKDSIKDKLLESKKENAKRKKENEIMKKIVDNSQINLPQIMIDEESEIMVRNYNQMLNSQGLSLDIYLHYMGQSADDFQKSFNNQSEFNIKSRYVLEDIAKKEKFDVAKEDIEKELDEISKRHKVSKDSFSDSMSDKEREALIEDIKVQKALDLIFDSAVEI